MQPVCDRGFLDLLHLCALAEAFLHSYIRVHVPAGWCQCFLLHFALELLYPAVSCLLKRVRLGKKSVLLNPAGYAAQHSSERTSVCGLYSELTDQTDRKVDIAAQALQDG